MFYLNFEFKDLEGVFLFIYPFAHALPTEILGPVV